MSLQTSDTSKHKTTSVLGKSIDTILTILSWAAVASVTVVVGLGLRTWHNKTVRSQSHILQRAWGPVPTRQVPHALKIWLQGVLTAMVKARHHAETQADYYSQHRHPRPRLRLRQPHQWEEPDWKNHLTCCGAKL